MVHLFQNAYAELTVASVGVEAEDGDDLAGVRNRYWLAAGAGAAAAATATAYRRGGSARAATAATMSERARERAYRGEGERRAGERRGERRGEGLARVGLVAMHQRQIGGHTYVRSRAGEASFFCEDSEVRCEAREGVRAHLCVGHGARATTAPPLAKFLRDTPTLHT